MVVVEAAQITPVKAGDPAPKDGWFVTSGWITNRLESEQALEAALERCKNR